MLKQACDRNGGKADVSDSEDNVLELTIAQAAQRLGVSMDTIRRRISNNELKAHKVPSSHGEMYVVELPDDTPEATQAKGEVKPDGNAELETLRKMVNILETELEARRREIQELHVLLQQAQSSASAAVAPPKIAWWRKMLPKPKQKVATA